MSSQFENSTTINNDIKSNNMIDIKEKSLENFNCIQSGKQSKKRQYEDTISRYPNQNGVKIQQKCDKVFERAENQNQENEQNIINPDQIQICYQTDQDLTSYSFCENGNNKMKKQIKEDCELLQRLIKNKKYQIEYDQLESCLKELSQKGYRIKSYISKGGEGIIFKGYSEKLNEEVAIKFYIFEKQIKKSTIERTKTSIIIKEQMDKEKTIESNIKCFNYIVKTYDIFICKKMIVQVMEYCYSDLKRVLEEEKFTQKEMINIMFQCLNSLVELHINGIAHLDIKPANILIKENRDIKITDFGLSEIYEQSEIEQQKKSINGLTEKYSSPEQLYNYNQQIDQEPIDFSSDIFSMGLTFLVILGYDLNKEKANKIRENKWEEIEFPQENKNLFTFIKYYMLNKDPQRRFRATILKRILHYYYKKYIDMNSENTRIESLINEKTSSQDRQYSSVLSILLADSTQEDKNLIKSLQMQENLKNLIKQDEIHFKLVHVRSLIGKDNQKALEILEELSKEEGQFKDNINYLYYLTNFGNLYFDELKQYQESLKYYKLNLEATNKFFDNDHPFISQAYHYMAKAYRKLWKFDLALQDDLKSLEMRNKYWAGDHPDFLQSFVSLNLVYYELGNYEKQMEYYYKAQKIQNNLYPDDQI